MLIQEYHNQGMGNQQLGNQNHLIRVLLFLN